MAPDIILASFSSLFHELCHGASPITCRRRRRKRRSRITVAVVVVVVLVVLVFVLASPPFSTNFATVPTL